MPGERRGGRTRATPNRRTILADRIVAVLDGCSRASPKERLSKLINDAELPADIRMTVAQKAFPNRTGGVRRARRGKSENHTVGVMQQREPRATEAPSAASPAVETMSPAARDALLGIVSDASASAKARRKAAAKLAAHFLPKQPVNTRWRFTADECGFAINGEIAREYRAIDFELRDLKRHRNRDFPEIAQKIRKLQARIRCDPSAAPMPPSEELRVRGCDPSAASISPSEGLWGQGNFGGLDSACGACSQTKGRHRTEHRRGCRRGPPQRAV